MTVTLRALVVDDDVSIRLLVTRILERRGFTVEPARDGVEAIERLSSTPFAVIILDLMMPRVDGAGVMKYLARYYPEQLPAVIVMTAFGAAALEALSPQPAHFLEKPFNVQTLVSEVNDCVATTTTPDPSCSV